jgi:preprotein translocase subunit SecD
LYGFIVAVPGADVAAVTAVIRHAYDARSAVGISVADKLWQAPQVQQPFPGQRLQITLLSRTQARELHRILIPSG